MNRKNLGNLGEKLALKKLLNKGYKLLEKNFRSCFGEIDLIMKDNKTLVFIEVKTRTSDKFGNPELAIGKKKINSIKKTAWLYKLKNPSLPDSFRIDVVSIELNDKEVKNIKYFKNVVI